jgi:SAM-dependent methyltransferase
MGSREDEQTRDYFQTNIPEYWGGRYNEVIRFLGDVAADDMSLLDIGCGTGNILAAIRAGTCLSRLTGVDTSSAYLDKAGEKGFTAHEGSITDEASLASLGSQFDFVLVGAVLHHLVASGRRSSRALAELALKNALGMVRRGGRLILMEPTFRPRPTMTAVFHIKRLLSRVTKRRIELFGKWNNIGEPIVSYYSTAELEAMVRAADPNLVFEQRHVRERALPLLWRLAGVTERSDVVLVLKKP